MDALNYFEQALLVVFVVHYVCSLALFVLRRSVFPIKGHAFALSLFSAAVLGPPVVIGALLSLGVAVPCWMIPFLSYPFTVACCTAFVLRSWRLVVLSDLQTQKMEKIGKFNPRALFEGDKTANLAFFDSLGSMPPTGAPKRRWYEQWRKYCTDRNFFVMAIGVSLTISVFALWIPYSATSSFSGTYDRSSESPCDGGVAFADVVMVCCIGITAALAIGAVWKLRNVSDGFMIKRELKFNAFWAIFGAASIFVFNLTDVFDFGGILAGLMLNFFTLTWKVLASYGIVGSASKRKQVSKPHRGEESQTVSISCKNDLTKLENVLRDPKGMNAFSAHLAREFSAENLLFWQAAQAYEFLCRENKFASNIDRTHCAVNIFRKYIGEDADDEVNISATKLKEMTEKAHVYFPKRQVDEDGNIDDLLSLEVLESSPEVPIDFFSSAAEAIFNLMRADSFLRFTATNDYKEFVKAAENEARRGSTRASQMVARIRKHVRSAAAVATTVRRSSETNVHKGGGNGGGNRSGGGNRARSASKSNVRSQSGAITTTDVMDMTTKLADSGICALIVDDSGKDGGGKGHVTKVTITPQKSLKRHRRTKSLTHNQSELSFSAMSLKLDPPSPTSKSEKRTAGMFLRGGSISPPNPNTSSALAVDGASANDPKNARKRRAHKRSASVGLPFDIQQVTQRGALF